MATMGALPPRGHPTIKESPFLFVNSSSSSKGRNTNKQTKHDIRRHIMRDIGRSRRKRRKNPQFEVELSQPTNTPWSLTIATPSSIQDEIVTEKSAGESKLMLQGAFWEEHPLVMIDANWQPDPFIAYAVAITMTARKDPPVTEPGCFWFPFAFEDPGFYRKMLLSPAVKSSVTGGSARERSRALGVSRYADTLGCVQKLLSDPDVTVATSNLAINGVVGLIGYNYVNKDFAQAELHFSGLQHMIELRGGMTSFNNQYDMWLMIFWIDITAALLLDRKPRFQLPPSEILPVTMPRPQIEELTAGYDAMSEICPDSNYHHLWMIKALRDLKAFSQVIELELNKRGKELWDDDIFIGLRLNPLAHRLLSPPPTDCFHSRRDGIGDAARLGALLFIIQIKHMTHTFPGPGVCYSSEILDLLESEDEYRLPRPGASYVALRLWLLVLCALSANGQSEESVATIALVETMARSGVSSWKEVTSIVRTMPWVGAVLDERCDKLGRSVEKLSGG